jgi:hypothetical protein
MINPADWLICVLFLVAWMHPDCFPSNVDVSRNMSGKNQRMGHGMGEMTLLQRMSDGLLENSWSELMKGAMVVSMFPIDWATSY